MLSEGIYSRMMSWNSATIFFGYSYEAPVQVPTPFSPDFPKRNRGYVFCVNPRHCSASVNKNDSYKHVTFSMSRREIIADDLLTDSIVKLSLSASLTRGRGCAELKLHINMARGLTCPLVIVQYTAPKNNSAVKIGRESFPAGQTMIRRRLHVRLN